MADRYQQLTSSGLGRQLARWAGLPTPTPLRRHRTGDPVLSGTVLAAAAENSRLGKAVAGTLDELPAQVAEAPDEDTRYAALVFDATGITSSDQLRQLHAFFSPSVRQVDTCGRVIVLGTPPEDITDPAERTAQRALEGFVRTVGKELKQAATAQLVYVSAGAEDAIDSTLRFLLSPKSAFVSGQVIRIGAADVPHTDRSHPLRDRTALVTGASRGIGESIAETLARDGAHVVCLDIPAQGEDLARVANRIGGSTLQLDITAEDAPQRIMDHFAERHDGLDVVVHNAGITRDKTLARMSEQQWDSVLTVNLGAQERINEALLAESSPLRRGGRLIGVASIAGIAGNVGQANYATSKAGVIGHVQSFAPRAAERAVTINAVAPGFIETSMTAAIPLVVREAGRRMNSLSQGGLPIDVAETIAWYANPASGGVNGNVVRVCGQSLLGA
ncbi:3-oxoacyl-[acyl-carrier protein] reductase [Halopolyspora algeriensis]|uniref:3-oxoacyl-[acyl-carrier protein] reductase n=1 Tax=Halopolyspora algeriensis TaxID=1500506 RepID=A0A368VYA9_9ACTN|nr:3-oxoacyl-ACP reductase [Halopolyspora algeriensis]RCW47186.1 3-oxoacyl-[acyl-carrier protein] reductase [Halopolyspora algeriensis]TQM48272.1 3-oxoacyl-[acyl-carrier protein] reductase [Halopolyspora algeriensis]